MPHHLARGVRGPVAESLVRLDHQQHLIGVLREAVVLLQAPEVVEDAFEHAKYVILHRKRPETDPRRDDKRISISYQTQSKKGKKRRKSR